MAPELINVRDGSMTPLRFTLTIKKPGQIKFIPLDLTTYDSIQVRRIDRREQADVLDSSTSPSNIVVIGPPTDGVVDLLPPDNEDWEIENSRYKLFVRVVLDGIPYDFPATGEWIVEVGGSF